MSVSQLTEFERCNRRWFFRKVRRVAVPESPQLKRGARDGTEIHRLIELYYRGAGLPAETHPHYHKVKAAVEHLPAPAPYIEVERRFKISGFPRFTGIIDWVARQGTTVKIVDHKTTSNIAQREREPVDLNNDPQMLTYAEVEYQDGAECVEVAHNTISTRHKARVLPLKFVTISRERSKANWDRQKGVIEKMVALAAAPPADWNDVACNTEACDDYGGCDFLSICTLKTPTIGMRGTMAHDQSASSDLLARLAALSGTRSDVTATVAPVPTVNTTAPAPVVAAPVVATMTADAVPLLPPDAPTRMTPQPVAEVPAIKGKRGRKPKAETTSEDAPFDIPRGKWRYHADRTLETTETIEDYLNAKGADGWELVGFYDGIVAVFKRPE